MDARTEFSRESHSGERQKMEAATMRTSEFNAGLFLLLGISLMFDVFSPVMFVRAVFHADGMRSRGLVGDVFKAILAML